MKVICFGGYIDERVMAVRNVEVMTAVNGEVANVFVYTFDAGQLRFAVRQRFHAFRVGSLLRVGRALTPDWPSETTSRIRLRKRCWRTAGLSGIVAAARVAQR